MKKPEIILIGGGGHCKSCIDIIEKENNYSIKGIIDLPEKLGSRVLNYSVIGIDDDLPTLAKSGFSFLITIGHMSSPKRRIELYNIVKNNGGNFPTIISPDSSISKYASIGEGTIIMKNCIIDSNSIVGNNCIINNKSLIGHDCVIENNCHISTDVNVNGHCFISKRCFIGSGANISNGLKITEDSFIGIGAVVIRSIELKGVYFGTPAKKIK